MSFERRHDQLVDADLRDEVHEGRRRRRGGPEGVGVGAAAGRGGVALLPPRISPFSTDGMSVRNSIFRTAERAMPPKIATIGFQMPRPWNFIFVMPSGASKSSDSIATFGRSPLPRTTSFPSTTLEVHARHCAADRVGLDRRVRSRPAPRACTSESPGRSRAMQVGLDIELAVLDERAQPIERCPHVGSRGRARSGRAVRPAAPETRWPPEAPSAPARSVRQPPAERARARAPRARAACPGDITAGSRSGKVSPLVTIESAEAVLMTGPGRPLETRASPAPRAREGGAILETVASEVCGTDVHLHHGRLSGVPYPIIPGHVSVGRVLETGGPLADVEGRRDRRRARSSRSTTSTEPAAPAGTASSPARRRAVRSGASTASRRRRRTACSAAGPSGSRSCRACARAAAGGAVRGGLPGRRLRPADRVPRRRTGGGRHGRHGRRPGQRARRVERRDLRAALGRAARPRRRRSARRASTRRAGSAPRTPSTSPRSPEPADRVPRGFGTARRDGARTS